MKETVLITGASRGIGRETALAFAKAGYNVVINCKKSMDALQELKDIITSYYEVDCLAIKADVAQFSEVSYMFEAVKKRFGGVDILVNNAGISMNGLLTDMTDVQWREIVDTNLTSVFNCCKLAVPYMVGKKGGHIVNVSSVWGIYGASCEVAYSATKGGINAFTKALAKELAPSSINVNAVAFGAIDTDMNKCYSEEEIEDLKKEIGMGRMGTAIEAANLIFDLATAHPYLTGQVVQMDGGWI